MANYQPLNPETYFTEIENASQQNDCKALYLLMLKHYHQSDAALWTGNILAFGKYKYHSKSYSEWFNIGLAPKKNFTSLYFAAGFNTPELVNLVAKIGKAKINRGCINFKSLSDINLDIVEQIIVESTKINETNYLGKR